MTRTVELLPHPGLNELETEARECVYDVDVRVDGKLYAVNFYTVGRLEFELNTETKTGKPWFGEPGIVVLETVNFQSMRVAVKGLAEQGFFDGLIPKA